MADKIRFFVRLELEVLKLEMTFIRIFKCYDWLWGQKMIFFFIYREVPNAILDIRIVFFSLKNQCEPLEDDLLIRDKALKLIAFHN